MTAALRACAFAGALVALVAGIVLAAPPVADRVAARVHEGTSFLGGGVNKFGHSVAGGGDVNNDGFPDFIGGESWDSGHVYVFYGGPAFDDVADVVIAGEGAWHQFGASVAMIGVPDVRSGGAFAVGAPGYDTDRGRVTMFRSSSSCSSPSVFYGETAGDRYGAAVAGTGDVSGDGFRDLAIGASGANRVEVIHAPNPELSHCPLYFSRWQSDVGSGSLGASVAGAGDFDGDGVGELLAGAPGIGSAYLFADLADGVPDLVLAGTGNFGSAVTGAGDLDGDGFDDVVVGAPSARRAYVFRGGATLDSVADLELVPLAGSFDEFGSALTAADFNDDGFADVAVGAWMAFVSEIGAGRVYIYFGGPGMDGTADVVLSGRQDELLGYSLASAGDFFGDGCADLLVGAPYAQPPLQGFVQLTEFSRYDVLEPVAGAIWNVGAREVVRWKGAERADLWLSVDGGATFESLARDVGGGTENWMPITVPHLPSRFAVVRATPHDGMVRGRGSSDSLFTIDASVELLSFTAGPSGAGDDVVAIRWATDPGPEKLAGYHLERASGDRPWQTLVRGTRETNWTDRESEQGARARYRISAINGLGEEYLLGETAASPSRGSFSFGPVPYRGGELAVVFETLGSIEGEPGPASLALYDVSGRRLRTLVEGQYEAGRHRTAWDGKDYAGHPVAAGVYFLRLETPTDLRTRHLVVTR